MLHTRMVGTLAVLGLLLCQRESRADSIRCGDQLASNGASLYEVKTVCGNPDMALQRVERRTVLQQLPGPCFKNPQGRTVCGSTVAATIEVVVDEWTYDFGQNRFLHFVKFEDGRMMSVTTGGYGKKPPA